MDRVRSHQRAAIRVRFDDEVVDLPGIAACGDRVAEGRRVGSVVEVAGVRLALPLGDGTALGHTHEVGGDRHIPG